MGEVTNNNIKKKLLERDGLRCSISGEYVSDPDDLEVRHITPTHNGGTSDLSNLQLVKKGLNKYSADLEIRRANALAEELLQRQKELANREKANFEREHEYRKQIEAQQIELDKARESLLKESKERELEFSRELKEQRERLKQQQRNLIEQEKQTQEYNEKLRHELELKEASIKETIEDLQREKERYREESRNNIQIRSNAYVNDAISALDAAAVKYHSKGKWWSILGSLSLAGGVITGIVFGVKGLTPLENGAEVSWPLVSFLAFKGVIVIGLFIALSKYCFTYSQSFTHEAIKNSERKHAINFGKFYLETYGAEAQWSQVKEAFEHWNINSTSAFSGNDPDKFDPKIFDKAMEIAKAAKKFGREKSPPQP